MLFRHQAKFDVCIMDEAGQITHAIGPESAKVDSDAFDEADHDLVLLKEDRCAGQGSIIISKCSCVITFFQVLKLQIMSIRSFNLIWRSVICVLLQLYSFNWASDFAPLPLLSEESSSVFTSRGCDSLSNKKVASHIYHIPQPLLSTLPNGKAISLDRWTYLGLFLCVLGSMKSWESKRALCFQRSPLDNQQAIWDEIYRKFQTELKKRKVPFYFSAVLTFLSGSFFVTLTSVVYGYMKGSCRFDRKKVAIQKEDVRELVEHFNVSTIKHSVTDSPSFPWCTYSYAKGELLLQEDGPMIEPMASPLLGEIIDSSKNVSPVSPPPLDETLVGPDTEDEPPALIPLPLTETAADPADPTLQLSSPFEAPFHKGSKEVIPGSKSQILAVAGPLD
ncbi:hypothetical protein NE237_027029 [Protea cynaroides]|uniref:Uncharacterized protein n=1 Tax=Protea cynaroides TaxID=273540 RepID=A0A9Q0GLT1_9MAGN|nr:hypothetical protein NE237_027029 [Protea cynaroides]